MMTIIWTLVHVALVHSVVLRPLWVLGIEVQAVIYWLDTSTDLFFKRSLFFKVKDKKLFFIDVDIKEANVWHQTTLISFHFYQDYTHSRLVHVVLFIIPLPGVSLQLAHNYLSKFISKQELSSFLCWNNWSTKNSIENLVLITHGCF